MGLVCVFGAELWEVCLTCTHVYWEPYLMSPETSQIYTLYFKIIYNQSFRKISLQLTKFRSTLRAFLHNNLTYEIIVTEWMKVHQLFLTFLTNVPMHFAKPSLCESRGLNFWTPYCGTRPRRCGKYGRTRQSSYINSKVPAKFSQKAGKE